MDELFAVQRDIGEICGVLALNNEKQETTFEVTQSMIEEPEEAVEEEKAPEVDENGNPIEVEGGEEKKVAEFNPRKFKWTITNGKSKNLPMMLRDGRDTWSFEEKNWKVMGCNSHADATVKSLDEFCGKVADDSDSRRLYQQVIFSDD